MENKKPSGISKPYLVFVLLSMLVLPTLSVFWLSAKNSEHVSLAAMIGEAFVFWAIGVRLFVAGIRQVFNPSFTAKNIFHLKEDESFVLVRELGFSNICFGLLGILSMFIPQWRLPAACIGGLFFLIAAIQHIVKKPAGANEWIALVSDVFIFCVVLFYIIDHFVNK